MVTTANPYAAEASAKILEAGGNAVDAAAAVAYALNVVEPQSAGIGGGFMLIHLASSGSTFAVDSRERAPALATPGMFDGKGFDAASTSGLAVGVPGMVRGTALAVQSWGNLTLAQVILAAARRHRYYGAPVRTTAYREYRWRDRPSQVGRSVV